MPTPSERTKRWLVAPTVLLALGCGDGPSTFEGGEPSEAPDAETPRPAPETEVGSLSFALETEHGSFETFSYVLTGPSFSRSGTLDVSNSSRVSALIEGIPVGAGYTVTLSGKSVTSEPVVCSGSATFVIRAAQVTQAPVAISCHFEGAVEEPPAQPTAAPLPPISSALLAVALLTLGAVALRRPRSVSQGLWS